MSNNEIQFNRILFPVDLSEESRRTAPFVRAMAEHFHAGILVLHVIEIPASYYMSPDIAGWEALANATAFRDTRKAELEAFVAAELGGDATVPEFAHGEPAREIARFAAESNSDLVMMPTHGYGGFRRLLLGSVTAKVLHDVECPVWTAAHTDAEGRRCPRLMPVRILCAVDVNSDSVQLICWATQLAQQIKAELHLVYAIPGGSGSSFPPEPKYRQHLIRSACSDMQRMQASAGVNLPATVLEGDPEEVVRNACQLLRADLVIVGRGRIQKPLGRLRSRAYAIIRDAPCPVISI